MWLPKNQGDKKVGNGLVAVAVDKDKNSQNALKWAVDNILQRGQTVILIHVRLKHSSHHHGHHHHGHNHNNHHNNHNHSSSHSSSSHNHNHSHSNSHSHSHSHSPKHASEENSSICSEVDAQTKEMLLPFRCFCTRKDIQCKDVLLEDYDVAKALIEYVSLTSIENLVIGATSRNGFLRFKTTDIPGNVGKGAPDFCNVYVIAKGKIQSMRSALRPAPSTSPLRLEFEKQSSMRSESSDTTVSPTPSSSMRAYQTPPQGRTKSYFELDYIRSPFTRKNANGRSYPELPMPDSDISFVSARGPSVTEHSYQHHHHHAHNERQEHSYHHHAHNERQEYHHHHQAHNERQEFHPRPVQWVVSNAEFEIDDSFESAHHGRMSELSSHSEFSSFSHDSSSSLTHANDDVEAEMKRLRLELKQTMEMYSTACKEANTANQKAVELQRWKREEEKKLEEARLSEEVALAMAEKERAKSKAAMEAAEAAKKIADLEAHKRIHAEKKAMRESEERRWAMESMVKTDIRYRRYTIEEIEAASGNFQESRKIGEGGYGPVYKCYLDHTPVAVKVLRPDAAQGRSQFQQEVEVLSCIRHPNMVLLLGACPEYGCLVYEFMANGSLEDRLFRRGNTPPLSWQLRFRIAAEIGTGLLFLHQSKPKPLVHRDLKPGNILLDRNFVSKISDVGLARLVPPTTGNDAVTQYRMTSTAGTFCYIDPEYQQTGMLGTKSDVYSLGILFLQLLTARPAMGLTHHVEKAVQRGTLDQLLDPAAGDWPMEGTLAFATMALKCAELRRKDRPDLCKVVLPELNRLRSFADEMMGGIYESYGGGSPRSSHSQISVDDSISSGSNSSSRHVSSILMP